MSEEREGRTCTRPSAGRPRPWSGTSSSPRTAPSTATTPSQSPAAPGPTAPRGPAAGGGCRPPRAVAVPAAASPRWAPAGPRGRLLGGGQVLSRGSRRGGAPRWRPRRRRASHRGSGPSALVVHQGDRAPSATAAPRRSSTASASRGLDHELAGGVLDADADLHDLTFPPPAGGDVRYCGAGSYASELPRAPCQPPAQPRRHGASRQREAVSPCTTAVTSEDLVPLLVAGVVELLGGGLGDAMIARPRIGPARAQRARRAAPPPARSTSVEDRVTRSLTSSETSRDR